MTNPVRQEAIGDHNTQIAGNANHVNGPGLIEELSAQRRLTEKAQEQISKSHELLSKSQEQIDRLLSIIERMSK